MKKISVNELFSGIGTQSLAFKYSEIPHEVVGIAEISKPAIKAYEVLHGPTRNYGDISQIEKLDYADFWTYSFPCFTGDTLVLTHNGNVKIKDITIGDTVLTHEGRYRKVVSKWNNGLKPIVELYVDMKERAIETTINHKFYVRTRYGLGYEKPQWVEFSDIQIGDLVLRPNNDFISDVFPIPPNYEFSYFDNCLIEYSIDNNSLGNWFKVKDKKITDRVEEVYDIEVEEDHSFVADGIVVHNCQDLSSGGKGAGLAEGTRSGLLWEVERLLEKSVSVGESPKYLLLENVPNLLERKHMKAFQKWLDKLDKLGYTNSYAVMNSSDYGVPQNRDRLFVVSIRKDLGREFLFFNINTVQNPGFKDFVDEAVNSYSGPLMIDPKISPYLLENYKRDLEAISKSELPIFTCECTSGFQDNRVGIDYAPTIRHQNTHTAIFYNNQIHKLTSKEAWRFMGIREEDYLLAEKETGLGKGTLYGLAGNAIVVNVLQAIYGELFIKGEDYETI